VLAIGVLAGCAQGSPDTTAVPSASPAEPVVLAEPVATLDVACADVLSDQAASDLLQSPVSLKVNSADIRSVRDVARLQAGMLTCVWGGEDKTDNSWNQSIVLSVLPDAAADYDAGVEQVDDGAIVYTVGDLSEYLCSYVDANMSQCAANLLIDGYWAQVSSTSVGTIEGRTQATADQSMESLLDTLAGAITGSSAAPAWSAAPGAVSGGFCSDPGSTAVVQTAFASSAYALRDNALVPPLPAADVAQNRAGMVSCSWADGAGNYVSAAVVPGGSWSMASLKAAPPQVSYDAPELSVAAVAGADGALIGCGGSGYCVGILSVGGSLLSLNAPDIGVDAFTAAASATAAAVVSAG